MGKRKTQTVTRKLTDLVPDARNANAGTPRGLALLDDSLREDGARRGILLDRNGNVIAGNKTVERAIDDGFEEVIVVPTDGKQLVATQRVDIDLDSPQGRRMAIRDNRIAEVDLAWDPEQLQALAAEGLDLEQFWNEGELGKLMDAGIPLDYDTLWQGMPEFKHDDLSGITLVMHFVTEQDRQDFFRKIEIDPAECKHKGLWYPRRPEALQDQLGHGLLITDEP